MEFMYLGETKWCIFPEFGRGPPKIKTTTI